MQRCTDFAEVVPLIRPGSTIVLHSACAEPQWLVSELARHAARLCDVCIYTLMPMGAAPYAGESTRPYLSVRTFYPGKGLREALRHGRAAVLRVPLSEIPGLFRRGQVRADLLFLQLSPPGADGDLTLGITADYMRAVLDQDPVVVAEINPAMPSTHGDTRVRAAEVDYWFEAPGGPLTVAAPVADAVDLRIADHVAELIRSGMTVQTGIGALPDLVLGRLTHLHDLGIHSGVISDSVVPLMEKGVVTNARKPHLAGKTVTTMAVGSAAFYRYLDQNPAIELHPCSLTHDHAVLRSLPGFCAINSALQIDLAGNVNAEQVGGRIIASPGGLPDFARGARAAPGGQSIVALRATSKDGRQSNVLRRLPAEVPVAVTADMLDYVVTEFGVARLSGLSAAERARQLAAIAHPDFRAELSR